jgi:hypothetical protein
MRPSAGGAISNGGQESITEAPSLEGALGCESISSLQIVAPLLARFMRASFRPLSHADASPAAESAHQPSAKGIRTQKERIMTSKNVLTAERLRSLMEYSPESGVFTWLKGKRAGHEATSRHGCGYLTARVDGRAYLLHRLAWLYVHGRWPNDQIDHINGDRSDNRLSNLRECTNAENCQNVRAHCDGSGFIGAAFDKRRGRWQAGIGINGRRRFLGYFDTPEQASAAYQEAKKNIHAFGGKNA